MENLTIPSDAFDKIKNITAGELSSSPELQDAVTSAANTEAAISEIQPDLSVCPIISQNKKVQIMNAGMKRIQRGGPRRKPQSEPTELGALGASSGSEPEDGQGGYPTSEDERRTLRGQMAQQDIAVTSLQGVRSVQEKMTKSRQEAIVQIASIDKDAQEAQFQQEIEEIMVALEAAGGGFGNAEQAEEFKQRAINIRENMRRARGNIPSEEETTLQDSGGQPGQGAAEKNRMKRIKELVEKGADKSEEETAELEGLQKDQERMLELIKERSDQRYYYALSIMTHVCAAIAIGYTAAPESFFNGIGNTVRDLFSMDNLAQSCDDDDFLNLLFNGDCQSITDVTEGLWRKIFGVIGYISVLALGIMITDTSNMFMVVTGLSMYSIDALAMWYRSLGGIRASVRSVASGTIARGVPIAQTVGGVITWPLSRLTNVCRRMVGAEPVRGGRKRRRTMKHKRKTRGRKGKKMRRTKNKRKRGSRKKQRGGQCGPMKHPNMTDLYRPNPSAMGGKKRRKGRKGRKTRGKSKRRYGKKHGTRKR